MSDIINARQINAAMGMLGLSNTDLAAWVGCNRETISRARNGNDRPTGPRRVTLQKIKAAFERAGVRFTATGGVEPAPSPGHQVQEARHAAL